MHIVEGPTRQPLPYGLFSVLTPRSTTDPHWQHDGVMWETLTCEPVSGIGGECDALTGLPLGFVSNGDLGEADVFHVYGSYNCSPVGHTIDYAQERATLHLVTREEAFVERTIWTGDLGNTPFAADASQAVAGTVSIVRAISALESWLATNYGSMGVLHMTREAAELGISARSIVVVGTQLRTRLGTPVVAGAGYPGTSPTNAPPAPNTTYVYATPGLLGYRSEIFPGATPTEAGFDRSNNDLYATAERTYSVGWDPCGTAYAVAVLA